MSNIFYTITNGLLKWMVTGFFNLPFIEDHSLSNKKVKETVSLYPETSFGGLSAKIRFWDSPLERLEKYVPKQGTIVDLGCGEGILTNYLAICEAKRRMVGIELNKSRTIFANRGLRNTTFVHGDVLKKDFPKCDAIVMSHMMHHLLSYNDQIKLLDRCWQSLNKDGLLVIAEVDKQFSFKYLLGWVTDTIIVPILFEKQFFNGAIHHRSLNEWKQILPKNGFKIMKIDQIAGGPFPDIIILTKRIVK